MIHYSHAFASEFDSKTNNTIATILFDSGATHSFVSSLPNKLEVPHHKIGEAFSIVLPSGEVLMSTYWLCGVPLRIMGRELIANLIVLDMLTMILYSGWISLLSMTQLSNVESAR